jgi:small subunit ribosomal protein S6
MTLPAATYDLVMLLDPDAEEATRAKLVADARAAIEAQGEFLRHDDWGNRALSYPIERRNVAEYHLLQFHAHTPALLSTLDRSLRIADDILRFRIIKLKPGVPDAPDMLASPSAPRRAEPGADGASGDAPHPPPQAPAPGEPQPEPAPDAAQEPSAGAGSPPAAGSSPAPGSPPAAGSSPAPGSPPAAGSSPAPGSPPAAESSPSAESSPAAESSPTAGSSPEAGSPGGEDPSSDAEAGSEAGAGPEPEPQP